MDRAFGVVDGEMHIRIPTGIGIRNGDAPSGLAGTPKRLFVIVAIEQRVRHVAIAVGCDNGYSSRPPDGVWPFEAAVAA
jgi:hypothetical protein